MGRPIDEDTFIERITKLQEDIAENPEGYCDDAEIVEVLDYVLFLMGEQPAVDAVAVVRCKACKHRTDTGFCRHPRYSRALPNVYPDDFCSYGERRSDGDSNL